MSSGVIVLSAVSLSTLLLAITVQSHNRANATLPKLGTRTHAVAEITVQSSTAKPYDQSVTPTLMEIDITETFRGDMDGESTVRALQTQLPDKSANMVSLQRFRGKLGGRRGTFVLQGSEVVDNGQIQATWTVVPGSGTGELMGLRGEGGFEGSFGKGSRGTLVYWFE